MIAAFAFFLAIAVLAFFFAGWRYALLAIVMAFPVIQFVAMQQGEGCCAQQAQKSGQKEREVV